jgi:hypothetical protein
MENLESLWFGKFIPLSTAIGVMTHAFEIREICYMVRNVCACSRYFWYGILLFSGNNQITSIPSEIGLLTNLNNLYIGERIKLCFFQSTGMAINVFFSDVGYQQL